MPTLYTVTYGGFTVYEGTDVEAAQDKYRECGPYGKIYEDEDYIANTYDDEPRMDDDIEEDE